MFFAAGSSYLLGSAGSINTGHLTMYTEVLWQVTQFARALLQNRASTLSFFQAIKIVLGCHVWMEHWRLCGRAVMPPLLVFLLALRHTCLTQRVSGNVESGHLVNSMQIHATLREHVFTPRLIP